MSESKAKLAALPVDGILGELCAQLKARRCAVLRAPTGSGKTTRVAPALLDAGLCLGKTVWLLEPRRLAARAAARRIAAERGVELGQEVGYRVRFDSKVSQRTRLVVATLGMLLRRLAEDPECAEIGAILLDEFHERSLDADLVLALARRVQQELRPDLLIVVMSATLDAAPLAAYLGDAPVCEAAGQLFEVELLREPARAREPLEECVARAMDLHGRAPSGDALVFLPGQREIRACARRLLAFAQREGYEIFELYGDLAPERQDAVFRRGQRPKLVLSTNIAESSVTLPDVVLVVDSGLERRLLHDPSSGLERLELGRIALASAQQRRGRAGRVRPGRCVRLWSEPEERSFKQSIEPEVRRADPARALLQLLAFGEPDPLSFAWFEAPSRQGMTAALARLETWGALCGGRLTELGQQLARLPLAPRLARLLLAGQAFGVAARAARAAALLSERDPFRRSSNLDDGIESDLVLRVRALEEFEAGGRPTLEAHPAALDNLVRVAERLLHELDQKPNNSARDPDLGLLQAIFEAFADRLAVRREPNGTRARLSGGTGIELARTSCVRSAPLFVALEVDEGASASYTKGNTPGADALCRMASVVEYEWLDPAGFETRIAASFDPERERVVGQRQVLWRGLLLEQGEHGGVPIEAAEQVLREAAAADPYRALKLSRPELEHFAARVNWLRALCPELELPAIDATFWTRLLEGLCHSKRSFAELQALPLLDCANAALTRAQNEALGREAPQLWEVPSGSRIRLEYAPDKPPVLAVRIQELFGLAESPRLARGRAQITFHLLAPNHRPEQVTSDLKSFWNGAYQTVRKELRRRYPRHAWPEDPWNAPPERRPARRRPQA